MGSSITQKRIAAYNTLEEEKIELDICDLAEAGGQQHGTKITIQFPLKINN
jgi:hypothetical protein